MKNVARSFVLQCDHFVDGLFLVHASYVAVKSSPLCPDCCLFVTGDRLVGRGMHSACILVLLVLFSLEFINNVHYVVQRLCVIARPSLEFVNTYCLCSSVLYTVRIPTLQHCRAPELIIGI